MGELNLDPRASLSRLCETDRIGIHISCNLPVALACESSNPIKQPVPFEPCWVPVGPQLHRDKEKRLVLDVQRVCDHILLADQILE